MKSKSCLLVLVTYLIIFVSLPFLTGADITYCTSSSLYVVNSYIAFLQGDLIGDINGDKIEDIAVGCLEDGVVYIILGRRTALPSFSYLRIATNTDGVFKITGSDKFGQYVRSAGDINNDGFDDLFATNPQTSEAYIFYGKQNLSDLALTSFVSGTHGIKFTNSAGSVFGIYAAKAGDVNGDTIDDLMIMDFDTFYVIFGKSSMNDLDVATMSSDKGIKIIGLVVRSLIANSLATYGVDFNADGYQDLVFAVPPKNQVYVIFGGPDLKNDITLSSMPTTVGIKIYTDSSSYFGYSIANVHDMNGDGFDDILIGQTNANKAYLVYGRANPGDINVDTMTSTDGIQISKDPADSINSSLGCLVMSAGDINQDGKPDAFVFSSDRTYAIYGGTSLNSIIIRNTNAQILETGRGNLIFPWAAFFADLNGDGVKEIYFSALYGSIYQLLRGYTTTPGGKCYTCLESCLNCSDANTCTACSLGKIPQGSTCSCMSNQYFQTSTNTCTACSTLDSLCTACTDENTCTKCSGGSNPSGKMCNCTADQYFSVSSSCTACSTLDVSCTACTDSNTCTACSSGKIPYGNKCLDCSNLANCTKCSSPLICQQCNVGNFLSNDKCSACPVNCKVCTDSSTCQECFEDYVLENSACVDDKSSKDCSNLANCAKCSSPLICQQCHVGNFLSNDKCSACPVNCKVCTDSSTCQECFEDYVLENSACVDDKSLKGWQIALITVAVVSTGLVGIMLVILKCLRSKIKVVAINGGKTFVASKP